MNRALPIHRISNTEFYVDVKLSELREVENPRNTISFNWLKDEGTHYTFHYDGFDKNIADYTSYFMREIGSDEREEKYNDNEDLWKLLYPSWEQEQQDNIIKVPQMVTLDPEGMAMHYGMSIDSIKGKTDFEIMVDQVAYRQRMNGILPEFKICGYRYDVDLREYALIPNGKIRGPQINLLDLEKISWNFERDYWVCLHPETMTIKTVDATKLLSVPEDLIIIEIPTLEKLDAVNYARQNGKDIKSCVRQWGIKMQQTAKIISWNHLEISRVINQNKAYMAKSSDVSITSGSDAERRKRNKLRI